MHFLEKLRPCTHTTLFQRSRDIIGKAGIWLYRDMPHSLYGISHTKTRELVDFIQKKNL